MSDNGERRGKVAQFSLEQARKYLDQRNYARAFPHYLVFAQLKKEEFLRDHGPDFERVTAGFVEVLKRVEPDKIDEVYDQALESHPRSAKLLTDHGSHLFNANQTERAEALFRRALEADPKYLMAKDRLENLSSSLVQRWHFPMLNDRTRNSLFQAAIVGHLTRVQRRTVLDIGTGTGLLSLMASKAGAERVYACEASEVMAITAREVFIHNEEDGARVRLIPKLSVDMDQQDVPEKVSMIVTETFDSGLLGEHVLQTLHHAHQHLLAPGGKIVPQAATFFVAPIQSRHLANQLYMDKENVGYLDWNLRLTADHTMEDGNQEPYQSEDLSLLKSDNVKFLAEKKKLFSVNFESLENIEELLSGKEYQADFESNCDGNIDVIAGWFELDLDENNIISTSIESGSCWEQVLFPIKSTSRKVYKKSIISAQFMVKKSVNLEDVKVDMGNVKLNGNGTLNNQRKVKDMLCSSSIIQQLNCCPRESVSQWVAYNSNRDLQPSKILDLSLRFPDIALQLLKLNPASRLTLLVDTVRRREGRQMLDLVTGAADLNDIPMANVDCVSSLSALEDKYNLVLVSPVSLSGRLSQECLLDLETVRLQFDTVRPSMLLPHSLELWCVAASSERLSSMSRLVSDDRVMGHKIRDQVNILSVSHHQDILYQGLGATELSDPVHVVTLDLTSHSLERQELSVAAEMTGEGAVEWLVYWWVMDHGWGVRENTREGQVYRQAAVSCQVTRVKTGDTVDIVCQMEDGLMDLRLEKA